MLPSALSQYGKSFIFPSRKKNLQESQGHFLSMCERGRILAVGFLQVSVELTTAWVYVCC